MATGSRSSSRSVERLQAENEFLRRGGIAEEIGKTVRWLIVGSASVAGLYFVSHAIEALAGKQTDANVIVNFLTKFEVSVVLGWAAGGCGLAYGRSQRKLRKAAIERLSGRIQELETQIDPSRSTSRLTPDGDTNPEDK